MSISTLILLMVVVPTAFFMLVWVTASAYRLYFPDRPVPFFEQHVAWPPHGKRYDRTTLIGVRDIRAAQQRHHRERVRVPYEYVVGEEDGLPDDWMTELWERRN